MEEYKGFQVYSNAWAKNDSWLSGVFDSSDTIKYLIDNLPSGNPIDISDALQTIANTTEEKVITIDIINQYLNS